MAEKPSGAVQSENRELLLTRVLDAPPRDVFKAWTDPKHLMSWWGPQGYTATSCTMDLRPGGAWRVCMRTPSGADLWSQGVFREIVEPARLVFTFAWEDARGKPEHETLVTITFAAQGDKTKMTFHQAVFQTAESRDSHRDGWASAFDRLAAASMNR